MQQQECQKPASTFTPLRNVWAWVLKAFLRVYHGLWHSSNTPVKIITTAKKPQLVSWSNILFLHAGPLADLHSAFSQPGDSETPGDCSREGVQRGWGDIIQTFQGSNSRKTLTYWNNRFVRLKWKACARAFFTSWMPVVRVVVDFCQNSAKIQSVATKGDQFSLWKNK